MIANDNMEYIKLLRIYTKSEIFEQFIYILMVIILKVIWLV